ncbi:MAG: hypothetical protein KKC26_01835, partial [Nanoarchaeota archaeon]|nr:hypothetical protein [Nanoarchaeota archaeon]
MFSKNKIVQQRIFYVSIIFLLGFFIFKNNISENINWFLLGTSIILTTSFIILSIKNSKKIIKEINVSRKIILFLVLIILISVIVRFFVFSHYLGIYMDDVMRLDAAKNIAKFNKPMICEPIFEGQKCSKIFLPIGWPFVSSIFMIFAGISNSSIIAFSISIGILNILLAFILT